MIECMNVSVMYSHCGNTMLHQVEYRMLMTFVQACAGAIIVSRQMITAVADDEAPAGAPSTCTKANNSSSNVERSCEGP